MENKKSGKLSKEESLEILAEYSSEKKWVDWLYYLAAALFLYPAFANPDFLPVAILMPVLLAIHQQQNQRLAKVTNAIQKLIIAPKSSVYGLDED